MNFQKLRSRSTGSSIARRFIMIAGLGAMTFACMAASGGCGTDLHRSSVAADSIGASLNTAAQINHEDALESAADRAVLAGYIDGLAKLNDTFVADLKTAEASGGQLTSAQLIADFAALNAKAQALQAQGLLHLKSADAKTQFTNVTNTIQGLLSTIQAMIPTAAVSNRNAPARRAPTIGFAALVLTSEELTAALALLIPLGEQAATLVAKLTAMKDETDAQLQADALTQDAQAETIAEADGATAPTQP